MTLALGTGPDGALDQQCRAQVLTVGAMDDESAAAARARAILDEPGLPTEAIGELLHVLPLANAEPRLELHLRRALDLPDDDARWDALGDLVAALPDPVASRWERWFRDAHDRRYPEDPRRLHRMADHERTPAQSALLAATEIANHGASFEAWRLGRRAAAAPPHQRGPWLDRTLDAFEAIARTPVDPGNDEGPLWAVAHLLDEPRLRRALAIVERMQPAGWVYELGGSRASLATRLAWLGHTQEAIEQVTRIGVSDPFAAQWRATGWAGVLAARQAEDPRLGVEALVALTAGDPAHADEDFRYRLLDDVISASDGRVPTAAQVEGWVGFAAAFHDPRLRALALEHLAGAWSAALPVRRWLKILDALADPAPALETLAEAVAETGEDPGPVLSALLTHVGGLPAAEMAEWFQPLSAYRHALTQHQLRGPWEAWIDELASATRPCHVLEFEDFAEVLVAVEGTDAPLELGRAMLRSAR